MQCLCEGRECSVSLSGQGMLGVFVRAGNAQCLCEGRECSVSL